MGMVRVVDIDNDVIGQCNCVIVIIIVVIALLYTE